MSLTDPKRLLEIYSKTLKYSAKRILFNVTLGNYATKTAKKTVQNYGNGQKNANF